MSIALPPPSLPQTDTHALWVHCLEIAAARRTGTRVALPRDAMLTSGAASGWQLGDRWDAPARELFKLFKPMLDCRPDARPWVIAQLGQSLDGCIATRTGDSHFVNGPENLTKRTGKARPSCAVPSSRVPAT